MVVGQRSAKTERPHRRPIATTTLRPSISSRSDIHHCDRAKALVEDYRALQRRIGTTRNVIVQPSHHGTDNRCALDAPTTFGQAARAVVVVNETVSDAGLKRMDRLGVRGIRFHSPLQAGAADGGHDRAAVERYTTAPGGTFRSMRPADRLHRLHADRSRAVPTRRSLIISRTQPPMA